MAEARKQSNTKPKETKTVKTAAKKADATNSFPWKIIIGIIVAAVIIAGIIFCIMHFAQNKDDSKTEDDKTETAYTLENGKGKKIEAKYVSLDGYNYKLLAPSSFTTMSAEKIKEDYGETEAPDLVMTNSDNTVNLALSKPENALTDDQIEEYLNVMKSIFDMSAEVISTNTREVNGHKVAEIKLVTDYTDEDIYNHMAFFSYDGKLAIVSFNCLDDMRDEWGKIGEEMINSLIINQ